MTYLNVIIPGDSITSGEVGGFDYENGGSGCWLQIVADRLGNHPGLGPLLGPGFRHLARPEFTAVGSWTRTVGTDIFDVAPAGQGFYSAGGSTTTRTWHLPAHWRPVVGFYLYWIDYAAGGNWQYQVDGGAWVNMGQAVNHDNGLHRFYVAASVTSTVAVRAYDGTAATGCCWAGFDPFFIDPRGAVQGVVVHDFGVSSDTLAHAVGGQMGATDFRTVGDRLAYMDLIRPDIVISGTWSNDIALSQSDATNWQQNLVTLFTRATAHGATMGYMNVYEQGGSRLDGSQGTAAVQDGLFRLGITDLCGPASLNLPLLDLYKAWIGIGLGALGTSYAAANAQGFMADTLHPTAAGHFDIAARVYGFIRATFLRRKFAPVLNGFIVGQSLVGGTDLLGGTPSGAPSPGLNDLSYFRRG